MDSKRPTSFSGRGRHKSTTRPVTAGAVNQVHRCTSFESINSASARTSSPTSAHYPLPELNVSGVSAIPTQSFRRLEDVRRTIDGATRRAQLEKYKAEKEAAELEYDILEAKALMAEAELTWARPQDLDEGCTRNKETKKKIAEATKEIEQLTELQVRVSALLEAQAASDQTQKLLNGAKIPSPEDVQTLQELAELLRGAQLVDGQLMLPRGPELEEMKQRLEALFTVEEQKAVELATEYARKMALLNTNKQSIEAASIRLVALKEEKDLWEGHAKSLEDSLALIELWNQFGMPRKD